MILLLVLIVGVTEAQNVPSCATKLTPCLDYLNSTNPPASCCNPLKETVATELTCLCNLYSTPGLLEGFGINVTQALELSRHCGVTSDLSSCNVSGSAPSPSASTPPVPGRDDGSAGRTAFTGLSILLLFGAYMMFY